MNLQELRQRMAGLCDRQQAIVDRAVAEGRALTDDERTEFDILQKEIDGLAETIRVAEKVQARAEDLNRSDGKPFRPTLPEMDAAYRQQDKLDDGGFESLGEFIYAVRFGDPKGRLQHLPQGQAGVEVPDAFKPYLMPWRFMGEWRMDEGAKGGFAVPIQRRDELLMIEPGPAIVRPRATVIPAGDPPDAAIVIPAFAQGSKGIFGGVEVFWVGEGSDKPETGGGLREVTLQPHEVTAHTVVTDKLLRNWRAASSFLATILRNAIAGGEDMAFLCGDGIAKPIGVLNGDGTIKVNRLAANQIGYDDVVNMLSALLPESKERAMWIASQSAMPQITKLKDAAGNYIFIRGDASRGIPDTLMGIPIRFTGKTPPLGQKGDLMLVDFTYYLIKDGSGPFVAASEHVLFRQNKTVIKVYWNVDGKGWVNEPLTLEDKTTKVSPYVVLDVPAA